MGRNSLNKQTKIKQIQNNLMKCPGSATITRGREKTTDSDACKINKQTHEMHIDQPALSSPSEVITTHHETPS